MPLSWDLMPDAPRSLNALLFMTELKIFEPMSVGVGQVATLWDWHTFTSTPLLMWSVVVPTKKSLA